MEQRGGTQLVSQSEAARLLGVSRLTVHRACREGRLPVVRVNKRPFVPMAALDRLLAGGQVVANEGARPADSAAG